jgi:hypothetical protein
VFVILSPRRLPLSTWGALVRAFFILVHAVARDYNRGKTLCGDEPLDDLAGGRGCRIGFCREKIGIRALKMRKENGMTG